MSRELTARASAKKPDGNRCGKGCGGQPGYMTVYLVLVMGILAVDDHGGHNGGEDFDDPPAY